MPKGRPGDGRVAVALELDEFDDAFDRLAVAHLFASHRRQEQHFGQRIGAHARVPAGQQIVHDRHLRKQLAVLERACEPEPGDLVRLPARDVAAAKADLAFAMVDAAHAVEHAGLAGAVGADQGEQLARCHRERHAVEHRQAAEAQREPVDLELSHTISGCGDTA